MSFEINQFCPIGGQSTRGAAPQMYDYKHDGDSTNQIETSGYFNGARTLLEVDDIITVVNVQSMYQYRVIAVPLNGDILIARIPQIEVAYYYMLGNSTATTITSSSTPVKVAGDTTASALSSYFDVATTDNRAIYTGAIQGIYKVTVMGQLTTDSDDDEESVCMLIAKNGTTLPESQGSVTTGEEDDSTGHFGIQALTSLATNDYLEVFVSNEQSTENITVEYLSVIVERIH